MKSVDITWQPEAERFVATGVGGIEVTVNGPHRDPDAERTGASPADLLLIAAGTCSAWDVVEILRKQRQSVDSIEVRVSGEQETEPPWTFRQIALEFTVRGRGVAPQLAEQAVRLSEERYCSVTSTIRQGATVTSTVSVVETEAGADPRPEARPADPEAGAG